MINLQRAHKTMKIAIISGGSIQETFASGFLSEFRADLLIAADSGMDFCLQNGSLPDVIVGDFDSLKHKDIIKDLKEIQTDSEEYMITVSGKKIRVIRHRPEKDATDTELAVKEAEALGADEICLLGATGTRLDHVWGNISLLFRMRSKGIRGCLVDANNCISMPAGHVIRIGRAEQFGKYVSILPYGGPVKGLTLTGFHYPLENYTLEPGKESLCVSNEIEEEYAEIRYISGSPVVIESRD